MSTAPDPTSGPPDRQQPRAVLYLATWLAPELHTDFSTWCDEHHREQLRLPGFLRARRFEWVASYREDNPPMFLTMYDLLSLDALQSEEYRSHAASSLGLPQFLRGELHLERRDCNVIAAHPSSWWPPTNTSLLDVFQLNDNALALELRDHIAELPSDGPSSLSLRVIDSNDNEPLVLIDHEPEAHELIDALTASTGSLRSSWRTCFDEPTLY